MACLLREFVILESAMGTAGATLAPRADVTAARVVVLPALLQSPCTRASSSPSAHKAPSKIKGSLPAPDTVKQGVGSGLPRQNVLSFALHHTKRTNTFCRPPHACGRPETPKTPKTEDRLPASPSQMKLTPWVPSPSRNPRRGFRGRRNPRRRGLAGLALSLTLSLSLSLLHHLRFQVFLKTRAHT